MNGAREDDGRPDSDHSTVEDRFQEKRQSIGREELREVMDNFEEKIERIKRSPGPEFVRSALGHIRLFYRLLESWWNNQWNVPWRTITAVGAALIYFINPVDMIPDIIPAAGLIDDATMVYIAFSCIQDDLIEFAAEHDIDLEQYGIDPDSPRPSFSR